MSETLYEDATVRVVREWDEAARTETTRHEWKPGSREHNREQLADKARQARSRCRQIAQMPSFTAAQRDQAIRDLARIQANLIAQLFADFSGPGD